MYADKSINNEKIRLNKQENEKERNIKCKKKLLEAKSSLATPGEVGASASQRRDGCFSFTFF